jgi:hypothetical protein
MTIICSAMAVETALTRVFLKWREIKHGFPATATTEADRKTWGKEYRKGVGKGGFANSANFVSNYLTGKSFDDFVDDSLKRSKTVTRIKAGLTGAETHMKTAHISSELFNRRNRIMHWGNVKYQKDDAQKAFVAALNSLAVLKVMDKKKADVFDRELRAMLTRAR